MRQPQGGHHIARKQGMNRLYSHYGLDLEEIADITMKDIKDSIIDNQKLEAFDGTEGSISNVTKTLEVFSRMAENLNLIKDIHYRVIRENTLAIHTGSTFEEYTSYINRNYSPSQKRDLFTNEGQFKKQLKNETYLIKHDGRSNFNGRTKAVYEINLEKLADFGIEIDCFID